jgi:hypothetical protein
VGSGWIPTKHLLLHIIQVNNLYLNKDPTVVYRSRQLQSRELKVLDTKINSELDPTNGENKNKKNWEVLLKHIEGLKENFSLDPTDVENQSFLKIL